MKINKVQLTLWVSILIMVVTVMVSFSINSKSQKLPAVVKAEKTLVSSKVKGILNSYQIESMQYVYKDSIIANMENSRLELELDKLNNEKAKYESLISSTKSGGILKMELSELDEDIFKNQLKRKEFESDKDLVSQKMESLEELYSISKQQKSIDSTLYHSGILSLKEYNDSIKNYWKHLEYYLEAKSDTVLLESSIYKLDSVISELELRRDMLKKDEEILASKYLIDLDKVLSDIKEAEMDLSNLVVKSPVSGFVSDISKSPGEEIGEGDVIVEISNTKNFWITAYGNSSSSKKIMEGNDVIVYTNTGDKLEGRVQTISPVMEKIKSLSNLYETANTYSKIDIVLLDKKEAMKLITPGERLLVRVKYK